MKVDALSSLLPRSEMKTVEFAVKPEASFNNWLTEKVGETNERLQAADRALEELASGQAANLHQTMLTLEQAKLSFQFLEQLRNRLMSAYQELMREQI